MQPQGDQKKGDLSQAAPLYIISPTEAAQSVWNELLCLPALLEATVGARVREECPTLPIWIQLWRLICLQKMFVRWAIWMR